MTNSALMTRNETLNIESELKPENRTEIAEKLGKVLASTYVLYHKTQGFHWNVTGPMFISVHELTETQYKDLAAAIDDIAERVRTLGAPAPMGLAGYVGDSQVLDQSEFPTVGQMLETLARDHLTVADEMRGIVEAAEQVKDVYTADLLTARIGAHEEAAWMLKALAAS
ncbi:MAG: DNA starvation/stationary phase protection protein [Hyphomonadaceae bacterium]|nr:DNA starvation/stationary phase protection protein [Hyphomonadaceae bacterium]